MQRPLILLFLCIFQCPSAFGFTILHINDMHARVEGMRRTGGCSEAENQDFKCDGGWPRLLAAAKSFVQEADGPVVFIDNGDQFSGTPWSTFYRGQEATVFKNKFCAEAGFLFCLSGLGNHEFDFGYEATLDYVSNLNHQVIAANLDDQCDEFGNQVGNHVKKSVVMEIEGVSVGFIGYVFSDTPNGSSPPDCLLFEDEEEAMGREIANLQAQGINIIIGVGHSGLNVESSIAQRFEGALDIIISGHSHSFLWDEEVLGPVPAQSDFSVDDEGNPEINQDSPVDIYPLFPQGSSVPVVQAFFGSRYMGALDVAFDEAGVLTRADPRPVIVSDAGSSAPGNEGFVPDPSMAEEVRAMLEPLEEFINKPIGRNPRDLLDTVDNIRRIRQAEMPLGNYACDAMLSNAQKSNDQIRICMQNGGGIRAPLFAGDVTFGDVITVFPFGNVVTFLNFSGSRVHDAVEFGLRSVPFEDGAFLHFSKGFRVEYDPLRPPLSRVLSITLDGEEILNDESQFYGIVTNEFTARGGDGFDEIFSGAEVLLQTGEPQEDTLAEFIQEGEKCFVTEGRITPVNNPIGVDLQGLEFDDCLVRFSILHINDMHARVQGMRGTGGCTTEQNLRAECDGGWGRLASAAKRFVLNSDNPVLFFDNGDEFSGTVWSTFYKGLETFTFLNQLCQSRAEGGAGFSACFSGIGNHEFDYGYLPLLSFGQGLKHDILTSNIRDECEANSQGGDHGAGELGTFFLPTKIIEVQGKKVAIVGYTLKETAFVSSAPSCMIFEEEEIALRRELSKLKEEGVDLIIATGHSGVQKDLELAAALEDIDLIVGGHSHTFLWNEEVQGPIPAQSRPRLDENGEVIGLRKDEILSELDVYPRFAEGDDTPVLQAFFGSRYLGAVDLTFDFEGNLLSFERKSVILGNENSQVAGATELVNGVPNTNASLAFDEDPAMMELVNNLLGPLDEFSVTAVGEAFIDFDTIFSGGVSVRNAQTPIGNLVCDSMLHQFNKDSEGLQVDICFQNGGGIRSPIAKGLVNFGNVIEVHPFGNVLSVLEFTGQDVHAALEFSLDSVSASSGAFLAVGKGMKVVYDPRNNFGARVIEVTLNGEPILNDVSRVYKVVTNDFIANGGDGYGTIFTNATRILETGPAQEESLVDFLAEFCPTCSALEDRILPVVNPLSVDGVEIDVLGLVTPSCDGADSAECALDVDDDDDDESVDPMTVFVSLISLVSIALLVAIACFFKHVYLAPDEAEGGDGTL